MKDKSSLPSIDPKKNIYSVGIGTLAKTLRPDYEKKDAVDQLGGAYRTRNDSWCIASTKPFYGA